MYTQNNTSHEFYFWTPRIRYSPILSFVDSFVTKTVGLIFEHFFSKKVSVTENLHIVNYKSPLSCNIGLNERLLTLLLISNGMWTVPQTNNFPSDTSPMTDPRLTLPRKTLPQRILPWTQNSLIGLFPYGVYPD